MPNWEEIQREWETSDISFKDLAEKHGVKDSTIRSRKNREKWSRGNAERNATKSATQRKNVATKKKVFEPVVESDDLTDKQRLFCIYYIKYFNATKAYQKAYECAYTTARVEGSRTLANPNISKEIDRMKAEQSYALKLDVRDVLQKYIDIAFADITDFVGFGSEEVVARNELGNPILDDDGKEVTYIRNFVNFNNANEVDGTLITEISNGRNGPTVKLADKMKALDMLAKYTDLLSDNDKKRLQEEKLKLDIEKTKAEVKTITKTENDGPLKIIVDYGDAE
ncbi:terminase small subunit [Sporosarcina saromensis]|uniref:Terminase small subunit n=1 Tax=Sporosarcina saromensis TaxID=359365 RepID=A0ABU4GBM8_9BACL|nr:terminase small subunit [Sporosarcina saromensis]MDW0113777.1 terminase small subunit [Sporosarcina saromensis]